jgi:signal transduction histidine kinase
MLPAASSAVWFGAGDGSLFLEREGRFSLAQPGDRVRRKPVLALYEDDRSRVWIGTAGGGLACLSAGMTRTWTTADGLPSDVVAGIAQDPARNIWLATATGIYRMTRNALELALTNSQYGLSCRLISDAKITSTEVAGSRAVPGSDGRIWFATSEGVLNVNTRQKEIESPRLLLHLESVAFNGQAPASLLGGPLWAVSNASNTSLPTPADVRSLEIRFAAASFSSPDKIRFRHWLEGFDTDWVEDGATRLARYGRLPYGNYRFRLAARAEDGPWQEEESRFAFDIPAPPTPMYLRPWALALESVAAVLLVAGVVRVVSHRRLRRALARMEQQQSLERERMRIARDMHDEIGSKLTKISFLSEHASVEAKAGPLARKTEAIAETSRELLKTMDEIVWVVNPRNDTVEHLAAYLGHYAEEYFQNTTVECELRLPVAIPESPLSSEVRHNLFLAFEEALNNILKHALATKVNLEMTIDGQVLQITIRDNGAGFESNGEPKRSPRGGNGLRNMRQRLSEIGGQCEINSRPGSGTTVAMRIKLKQHLADNP